MAVISDHASNACLYTSYAVCLIMGAVSAYLSRNKHQFLSGNGSRSAIPLAFNFVASGLGCGILATYPQVAAYGGLHSLLVYSLAGAVPFILFGILGPIIRRRCPEGFVLTEWVRQRYGTMAGLVVSACTVLTIFLFMVSELASVKTAVETLTEVPGLPVLIVECVVVGIYTSLGGFYTAFFTDNLQVVGFLIIFVICVITVGCTVHIDKSAIGPSRLLDANLLGWKLMYILPVAVVTNDCFMAGFWLRTFASRTDRDLYWACGITGVFLFVICAVVGIPGLLAIWAHLLDPSSEDFYDQSNNAFYLVIHTLPAWLSGFVLVFIALMSCCTFDSLLSAMVSTISNDFFRNEVRMVWVRAFSLALLVPVVIVAIRAVNVLNIYLIVDVLSACVVPIMFFGLNRHFFFITGLEIIFSVVGGIITVFLFGLVYYGNASDGGALLLMSDGLYGDDWGAFGAFVAAPAGALIGALVALFMRFMFYWIRSGKIFKVFERPPDGAHYYPPVDRDWFTLKEPWYRKLYIEPSEHNFLSRIMKRVDLVKTGHLVDFWLFEQDESALSTVGKHSQRFHKFAVLFGSEKNTASDDKVSLSGTYADDSVVDETHSPSGSTVLRYADAPYPEHPQSSIDKKL